MAIKYCSWATGNDTTGDGSAAAPYKTITKATTGLTGGDEVRVEKSAAPVAIAATLNFTLGSTTVTATGNVFLNAVTAGESDNQVRRGDFVLGNDGYWYEIASYTNATTAVLFKAYPYASASGVTSQKLQPTDTGAAASSSTQIQAISASGVSASSLLAISGGWNLATETQDGYTWFRQMNSSIFNRYGYGLYSSGKNFISIDKIGFLRYYNGIYLLQGKGKIISNCYFCGNGYAGVYVNSVKEDAINNTIFINNTTADLYLNTAIGVSIDSCFFIASAGDGVSLTNSSFHSVIKDCTFKAVVSYSISLQNSNYNKIINPIANSPIYLFHSCNNEFINVNTTGAINGFTAAGYSRNNIVNGCTNEQINLAALTGINPYPLLTIQKYGNILNQNAIISEYGMAYNDVDNSRSGNCLAIDPSSATYYVYADFFQFPADSGVQKTITTYIKKDASFNGAIDACLIFNGVTITDWASFLPTGTDVYEQKSIIADAADIEEDGVITLMFRVKGTAGIVYIDDLAD